MIDSEQHTTEIRRSGPRAGVVILLLLSSFLLPLLIQFAAFAALKITPFGDNILLYGDSDAYYINYLAYFSRILSGEHGLLYSFTKGPGGNLSDITALFLYTPYMCLFTLAGWDYMPLVFSLAVIYMASLSGVAMYLLLADARGHKLSNLIFSTCYSLMGFLVVNNYNIVFSVGPFLLPLVILGLRKVLRGESPLLYAVSIGYSVACHFQMGFINCTAALLIFLVLLFSSVEKKERGRKLGAFFLNSFIGGLLSSVVWLPGLLGMSEGRAAQTVMENFVFTDNGPTLDVFARFFSGAASVSQLINGLPAVFCGILPLALALLFFLDSENSRKKKAAALILVGIYFLSFYIRTFTTVFHGFTTANWFNYRQSYVLSFLLILLAAEEFERLEKIPFSTILRCCAILGGVALLVFFKEYEFVSGGMVVMDFAILTVMIGSLWFYRTQPERAGQRFLVLTLLLCTSFQLYANYFFSMKNVFNVWGEQSEAEFSTDILKIQPLVNAVQKVYPGFYRMENENPHGSAGNDGMLFDYNGLGHASTERYFVLENMHKLGVSRGSNHTSQYDKGTPAAMDSFLGVRFLLSENDISEEKGYLYLSGGLGLSVYENPNALPIGILSNGKIMEVSLEEETDVFTIQNQIWKNMTGGTADVFTEETELTFTTHNPTDSLELTRDTVLELLAALDEKDSALDAEGSAPGAEEEKETPEFLKDMFPHIDFSFTAKQDGPVYFYYTYGYVKNFGTRNDLLQYLGTYQSGETVVGKMYFAETITKEAFFDIVKDFHVCYANMDTLAEYSELLRARPAAIRKDSDSRLSGDVTAEEGQRLLLTIPYDEGWTLWLDGVPAELEKTMDLFMSVELPEGTHHYEMEFWPGGLTLGLYISGAALIALLLVCAWYLLRRRREKKRWNTLAAASPEENAPPEDTVILQPEISEKKDEDINHNSLPE